MGPGLSGFAPFKFLLSKASFWVIYYYRAQVTTLSQFFRCYVVPLRNRMR